MAMDTALFTFMLQTTSSTQSVHLIGSWDNFCKHYPMERDSRRARTQWRGCYTFEDIICDGDGLEGSSSSKRSGGLRMGSTYYYYYELHDGTEYYDETIPFTTTCPYLPGQPVNTIEIPIEVQPLRFRSASMSSLVDTQVKTMNPADKFMAPRQPPPLPQKDTRLQTSTSILVHKRSARSLSLPKSEKSQWSPRSFFGLRSPSPRSPPTEKTNNSRGRSAFVKPSSTSSNNIFDKKARSVPHTRTASPRSTRSSSPGSPLRQFNAPETATYIQNSITIPDEIAEEEDYNFASYSPRMSTSDNGAFTQLAPPPSSRPNVVRSYSERYTSKPLPELPELQTFSSSLRHKPSNSRVDLPRSHFSTSTISTSASSPIEGYFDLTAESDNEDDFGDDFAYSPVLEQSAMRFGYSLPEQEYASEQTIKEIAGSRKTFGVNGEFEFDAAVAKAEVEQISALEDLMKEMGYLGEMIIGNAI